ncbi:MAG: UDP-2,3-diacylglucosamine diphosphatase [Proteobacteria bacterium]|nr:UDP-2,3-diacylglucosamine diphosphatase [Pseudomonadota bacterium]
MTTRLYISDLHLEDAHDPRYTSFAACLAWAAGNVDEVMILGDLTEMWIGDDDNTEFADALRASLVATTRQCQVNLMHGNRDFLIGSRFAQETGVSLISEPFFTADGILLCHGDALCTEDTAYQALRATLRGDAWQQDVLARSLEERFAIGRMMRSQSRESSANKSTNITDVTLSAVDELASEHNIATLIHGHTHRPGVHTHTWGQRYVLGAWDRCSWQILQNDTQLSLRAMPLVLS